MPSIFISGGAAGIGLATAKLFRSHDWTVGVYDVDEAALAAAAAADPALITGTLDVRDPQQWDSALADFTAHTNGQLDVLDNNAGILIPGKLGDISADAVKAQIDIDALGVTFGARAGYPYLQATPGSHLVNISSASAIYGQPGLATYSATKFYVAGLTEALELEWAADDIRVVSIWPLWAQTALAATDSRSAQTLGVRLTAEDVAEKVWESVHPTSVDRLIRRTSYAVGMQTTLLGNASKFVPNVVNRAVNKFLSN